MKNFRICQRSLFSLSKRGFSSQQNERIQIHNLSNGIKHVELNRPEKLNSLDMKMFTAIADTVKSLMNDKSLRAIVLSGKGKAFCAGLDVKSIANPMEDDGVTLPSTKMKELLKRPESYDFTNDLHLDSESIQSMYRDMEAVGNLAQDVAYLWRKIPVPVICALQGVCFGGGLQIALGADIRLATPDCRLSVMEAKWGLIPDMAGSIFLRELVRMDIAKDLTFTGRIVDGIEAEKLGLVTRVVDDPLQEAIQYAEMIAKKSPDSIAASKLLLQKSWVASEENCLNLETELQKKILMSYNQLTASARNFGLELPYKNRKDFDKEQ